MYIFIGFEVEYNLLHPVDLSSCDLGFKVAFSTLQSFSVKGHLPSKVVFRQRSPSVSDRLPSKVVFHQRPPSIKGLLPWKVVFSFGSLSFGFSPECGIALPQLPLLFFTSS